MKMNVSLEKLYMPFVIVGGQNDCDNCECHFSFIFIHTQEKNIEKCTKKKCFDQKLNK